MDDLRSIASSEGQNLNVESSRLPQVHALNCLREIFISTKLGKSVEDYVAECMDLAASRLESQM